MTRRWNPIGEMERLRREMAQILEQTRQGTGGNEELRGSWTPAADIELTEGGYLIDLDLPGIDPSTVELTVEKGVLTVSGTREGREKASGHEKWHLERPSGCFCRTFHVPNDVDGTRIEARSNFGVLTITLPKEEQQTPRSISVKVEE